MLVVVKELFGLVAGLEVVGEGHGTAIGLDLAQGLEFFAALLDQLVFVLGGWGGGRVVRHGR